MCFPEIGNRMLFRLYAHMESILIMFHPYSCISISDLFSVCMHAFGWSMFAHVCEPQLWSHYVHVLSVDLRRLVRISSPLMIYMSYIAMWSSGYSLPCSDPIYMICPWSCLSPHMCNAISVMASLPCPGFLILHIYALTSKVPGHLIQVCAYQPLAVNVVKSARR